MTASTLLALLCWLLLSLASIVVWLPPRPRQARPLFARTTALIAVIVVLVVATTAIALLGRWGNGTEGVWSWLTVGVSCLAAVLTGGAFTTSVLGLADAASRPTPQRVQRNVLRGGTWIGALERVGIVASLLAGWPDGIAVILAVKGLARYPELKTFQSTGAAERFIIGTFASIGWAAACAGVALVVWR
ncbi:hypothetical protein GCM10009841_17340 [Microlunatus panaciterrae]|uniref:Uncharacterized protein n=1 Tax=Microlunatus panaciterrae TaxID=400768 RepID=A0ABS2RMQ2_9ACTN|nr:hypothetical protein [Microlunatus panaciterrae]